MSILSFLASKMPALFSNEYRELRDKVKILDLSKKDLIKNNKALEKSLIANIQERVIIKENVRILTDIYNNLKYGASVVSLIEFHGVIKDLSFSKNTLIQLEEKIKKEIEQRDLILKELDDHTKELKSASKALERFGILLKI